MILSCLLLVLNVRLILNILRLIRFPLVFLVISCVLAGFYSTVFSGLAVGKIGYLPQTLVCAVCLGWGGAVWNGMFELVDSKENNDLNLVSNVSMSMSYIIASVLVIIALMLSMTVSLFTFFVVACYILCCLMLSSVIKNIPVLEAIFFAMQYILIVVLGMSAHSYIIYLIVEPVVYIPLATLFAYIMVLRIIKNVSIAEVCTEYEKESNDVEMDSIELSTEIDSVYPGNIDPERIDDFDVACKISDNMIKRNLSLILPNNKELTQNPVVKITQHIEGIWVTFFALLIFLVIPAVFVLMTNISFVSLVVLAINVLFLVFPVCKVIIKKNVTSVNNLYIDGLISISLFNSLVVAANASNPLSEEVLTVLGILCGIIVPLLILKKHFAKLA